MKEVLEKLKKKGRDGNYPAGCIHDEKVEFPASDYHHNIRICPKCLNELVDSQ